MYCGTSPSPTTHALSSTWDLSKDELGLNLLRMDFNLQRCRDDNVNLQFLMAWFHCKSLWTMSSWFVKICINKSLNKTTNPFQADNTLSSPVFILQPSDFDLPTPMTATENQPGLSTLTYWWKTRRLIDVSGSHTPCFHSRVWTRVPTGRELFFVLTRSTTQADRRPDVT